MGRDSRPAGFGERMKWIRARCGKHRERTSLRTFADEVDVAFGAYKWWEARGSYPGHAKLCAALRRLPDVRDPEGLAVWAETGLGDPLSFLGLADSVVVPAQPLVIASTDPTAARAHLRKMNELAGAIRELVNAEVIKGPEVEAMLAALRSARRAIEAQFPAAGGVGSDSLSHLLQLDSVWSSFFAHPRAVAP